jgi:hypothetical protein
VRLLGNEKITLGSWDGITTAATLGLRGWGNLNKPFLEACQQKYGVDAEMKAAQLSSTWQEFLKDPNWHPFKIVTTGSTAEVCSME